MLGDYLSKAYLNLLIFLVIFRVFGYYRPASITFGDIRCIVEIRCLVVDLIIIVFEDLVS